MFKVFGVAFAAALGAALGMLILRLVPDIQRYQKIRAM
jgi:hypothetical protein